MGTNKEPFLKKCVTCGKMFNPGKHKHILNCSKECLETYRKEHKTRRKKKEPILKQCATCGNMFDPGKHKETLNCSKECIKTYQEKHKEERVKKMKEAIVEKYGVDHISKIPGFKEKVKRTKKERYGNENFNNREKTKKTLKEKYGDENYQNVEKIKQTKKEKYGSENFNNREKAKDTIKEKYGVEHHLQTEECISKMRQTNLERYNTKYTFQMKETIENLKKYNQEVHGCDWYFESEEHKKKQRDAKLKTLKKKLEKNNIIFDVEKYTKLANKHEDGTIEYIKYDVKCKTCGNEFKMRLINDLPLCRVCYPVRSDSTISLELEAFIETTNLFFHKNNRHIIHPLELDFYIPSKKLAFEMNGNYYHSELSFGKGKDYHITKTEMCHKKEIKLIHIFEDEWIFKKEIIKSDILNSLGLSKKNINIKNCEVKNITNAEKEEFLEDNHILGDSNDSIRYGLFYKNEIVSVMTFLKKKEKNKNKNPEEKAFELTRFCLKLNTNIRGAFELLLEHFKSNNDFDSIFHLADCRWFGLDHKNTIYYKNDFKFIKKTPCDYYYLKGDYSTRIHRMNFAKEILSEGIEKDKNKTEWEIAQDNNFDRIWNCGGLRFELKK